MKKIKMSSILAVCLLATSPLFTAALCARAADPGSGSYEMVRVPGGSFQMGMGDTAGDGNSDERPVGMMITLRAFSIGKYEVTQALYESVMGYNPSHFNGYADSPKRPVEQVTWYDAVEFCNKLSKKERLQPIYVINDREPATGYPIESATVTADWSKNGYRLPIEAQWEYAAKGGNRSPFVLEFNDIDVNSVVWYADNSDDIPNVVGMKGPNDLGIYDMYGNVQEWCWDRGTGFNPEGPLGVEPKAMPEPSLRVVRGGLWFISARGVRSEYRNNFLPYYRSNAIGFRLARP